MQSIKEQHQVPNTIAASAPATESTKACLASRLRSNLSAFIEFALIIYRHHERKDVVG
jgi:hypothetical protein